MAPEVFGKKNSNEKCDIWSIGILTFEILSCFTPFEASEPQTIYNMVQRQRGPLKFKEPAWTSIS
jgi:calcium/calmodulin-dependent protein kinase I